MGANSLQQADENIVQRYEQQERVVMDLTLRKYLEVTEASMQNLLSLKPDCPMAEREEAEIEIMIRLRSLVAHYHGLYMARQPHWTAFHVVNRVLQKAIQAVRKNTLEHSQLVRFDNIVSVIGFGGKPRPF